MRGTWLMIGTATAILAACSREGGRGAAGDSATQTAQTAPVDSMRALSWRLESPPSWDDRVRMVDDPEGRARLAQQGIHDARLFEYLPHDRTIVPQTLLGVYVYDSLAWARLEAEEGPPQGELIARAPGRAYIVGLPQSNPFGYGSVDSVEFEKRAVNMEYLKGAFHVMR